MEYNSTVKKNEVDVFYNMDTNLKYDKSKKQS